MNPLFYAVIIITLVFSCSAARADEKNGEVEDLRERVERLEEMVKEEKAAEEPGHRLHPVHSLYGLKISGGITITAQGLEGPDDNPGGAAAISGDLYLESPVGEAGWAAAVFDMQRGPGIEGLTLFTSPNGNTTGTNADIESFNDTSVHLTQLYYEHSLLSDRFKVTVGQLDPTAYFDTNGLANDERTQFLANAFVNNPAVEFGGSDDFYSPGVNLFLSLNETFDLTIGVFEGDGDYADSFDNPFVMAEAAVRINPLGRPGNYRLYYWLRKERPDSSIENLADPTDPALAKAENKGLGISLDQYLSDSVGVWLRAGVQREKVAQFGGFMGGGVDVAGSFVKRANDNMGVAYGATFMGDDYEAFKRASTPGFDASTEHYIELYYSMAVNSPTDLVGFNISPDLQYVINPGGDSAADKIFIYGVRLQADF